MARGAVCVTTPGAAFAMPDDGYNEDCAHVVSMSVDDHLDRAAELHAYAEVTSLDHPTVGERTTSEWMADATFHATMAIAKAMRGPGYPAPENVSGD